MTAEKLAYTITEAAELVSVSPVTLRKAYQAGDLEVRRVGEKQSGIRITHAALVDWLNRQAKG